MKSVIISIRPQWVEKIASGKKTIEVRKSAPQVPFKCYIYCCKGNNGYEWLYRVDDNGYGKAQSWHGKVIGEFICDKVIRTCGWRLRGDTQQCAKRTTAEEALPKLACLTIDEIVKYVGSENREVCGLHISDLKIYDKPKELSEFKTPPCEKSEKACGNCKWLVKINTSVDYECECYVCSVANGIPITRPPQSWQYVGEMVQRERFFYYRVNKRGV